MKFLSSPLLSACGLALALAATTASAQVPIKMVLNWKYEGAQAWFFLAQDKGYFKEEGLDVQYLMLRAMFLPGKVTPEQQAFYVDLFQKVTQTPEYKDYMEKQALKPICLTGKDMLQFLEEDDALNTQLMTQAGFVAK